MARILSDKEIKDIAVDIVSSTPELKKLPTSELKEWLTKYKIKFNDEDIKSLEDELATMYGVDTNEANEEEEIDVADDGYDQLVAFAEKNKKYLPVVNLIAQVLNGGIAQYVENGYLDRTHEKAMQILSSCDGQGTSLASLLYELEDDMQDYANALKEHDEHFDTEPLEDFDDIFYDEYNNQPFYTELLDCLTNMNESVGKGGPAKLVTESLRAMIVNESAIEKPSDLVKGQKYTWTGGAEHQEVTYIGLTIKNPELKPGSSMGKGFLFQWDDGKYFELGMQSIRQNLETTEESEVVEAKRQSTKRVKPIKEARNNKYPMVVEINSDNEAKVHPAYAAMKEGKALESLKVVSEFEDEGQPCFNLRLVVEGEQYELSEWWLDLKTIKKMYMAEAGDRGAMQGVKNYLLRSGSSMLKMHKQEIKEIASQEAADAVAKMREDSATRLQLLQEEYTQLNSTPESQTEHRKRIKQIEGTLAKLIGEEKLLEIQNGVNENGLNDNGGLPFVKEDEEEEFRVDGTYTVSNSGGYEIMLSDDGDSAKVRDAYGSPSPKTSDWLPIEYVPNEDNPEEDDAVIDPQGYNIPMDQVMRVSNEASTDGGKTEDHLKKLCGQYSSDEISGSAFVKRVKERINFYPFNLAKAIDATLINKSERNHAKALIDTITEYYGWPEDVFEAADDEYYQVESKLKDLCFQYYQQQISQEEAIQGIQEAIKDSEELEDAFKEVAPDALIDAVISHYNWSENDLTEAINPGSSTLEKDLHAIAQSADSMESGADAMKAKILETEDDARLVEIANSSDGEELFLSVIEYYGWTDIQEALNAVVDNVEAQLKDICAKFYGDLLPNAEAIKKSKEVLDTCDDQSLKEAIGDEDEMLMYNIANHFKWDLFDLVESVKVK